METIMPKVKQKRGKRKKIIKFAVIGVVILLVIAAVFTFITIRRDKTTAAGQALRTARVTKGELDVSITGSAPIESADSNNVSPQVTSKITKVYHKEGDTVKQGDVLFTLDDTDAQLNLESTKNTIAQTQLTQDNNEKSVTGLNVEAPFSGQITNIQVKVGDTVGKGSPILTITDLSKLKVTLPFSGPGISGISVGSKATVNLPDLMQSVGGTVTYISDKPYTSASGGELYNVEITIDNPGSLKEGMTANAAIKGSNGTLTSVGTGALVYINSSVLKSDAGGTVTSLNVINNQFVNSGDLLVALQNDDLKLTLDTTDLKLQSLQRQLELQQEQLSYYTITAPNDGVITSQDAVEGDTVKPGDTLAVVADMNHMEFTVSIDELDISKVKVGQNVSITADALPETTASPLSGEVSKVAMEGTSQGGVTTYPVTISINDPGNLKVGMNVNGEIFVNQKKDVLMVPLEAVQKLGNRSYVMVVGSSGSQTGSGQQGAGNGTFTRGNRSGTNGNTTGNAQSGQNGSGQAAQGNNAQSGQAGNGQAAQGNNAQSGQNGSGQAAQGRNYQQYARNGNMPSRFSGNSGNSNTHMVFVETGINNDTYIEITSGLSEGEEVVLPQTSAASTQNNQQNRNSGFGGMMGGGFGGGVRVQSFRRSD